MTQADPATGPSPCRGCGLCCDDSLFTHTPLDPEDHERMRRTPGVVEHQGGLAIALPCPQLCNRECSIYAELPKLCRNFTCKSLRLYRRGELELDEFKDRVAQTLATRQELLESSGSGSSVSELRQQAAANQSQLAPQTQLLLMKFEMLLDRYFRRDNYRTIHEG